MVMEWHRSGNEVVSGKKAERKRKEIGRRQREDKGKIGYS